MIPKQDSDIPNLVAGPPGWESEPLPDGTIRLRRNGWGRLTSDLAQPFGLFLIGYYVLGTLLRIAFFSPFSRDSRRESGANDWLVIAILVPLGMVVVGLVLWAIWGKDELRVGQNQLEVRHRLFKWSKVKRISDGLLVLRWQRDHTTGGRGYTPAYRWKLEVRGSGGSATLDSRTERVYNGILTDVFTDGELPPPAIELVLLGEWLARQTGWNLDQPLVRGKGRWS